MAVVEGARISQRVTITDVAGAAGVSTATVSRVLTEAKPVSDALARRVKDVVEQLGYRPNPAAPGLLRGRSHSVGVVVPDLSNPYFAEVLKGVTAAAEQHDRRTMIADSNEDVAQERRITRELARWVDGIVLCSPRMRDADLRATVASTGNLVCINRVLRDPPVAAVVVDFRAGLQAICNRLLELGHAASPTSKALRRPGRSGNGSGRCALPGAAVSRSPRSRVGRAPSTGTAPPTRPSRATRPRSSRSATASRMACSRGWPSSASLCRADLSVTGFDDVPFSSVASPGLTTVTVAKPLLGQLAWHHLHDAATDHGRPAVTLTPELVVRGSTARPRRRRRIVPGRPRS